MSFEDLIRLQKSISSAFSDYGNQVAEAKRSVKEDPLHFFNKNNTVPQWIGLVGKEFKNRGFMEGLHGIANPFIQNNLIYPYAEPAISNVRYGNYLAGKPSKLLNTILGQQ